MSLKRGLFLALLCGSPFCQASNTGNNLEFTGTIVAQTCDVEISSVSQSIDLGQFSVEDFPAIGTWTKAKPFNINLKNCSRGITGTKIWFTGTADSDDPSLLALTDTGMGNENMLASGVGVEINNDDGDEISINNSNSVSFTRLAMVPPGSLSPLICKTAAAPSAALR